MWWAALAWAGTVETYVDVVVATETRSEVVEPVMTTSIEKRGATLAGQTIVGGRCRVTTHERVQRQLVRTYPRRRRDRPGRPQVEREVLGEHTRVAERREEPCEPRVANLVAVVSLCGHEVRAPLGEQGTWEAELPPCEAATLRIERPDGVSWDVGDIGPAYLTPPPPKLPDIPAHVSRQLPSDAKPRDCVTFERGASLRVSCDFLTPGGLLYEVEWSVGEEGRTSSDRCSPCYPDTCLCPDCGDYDCAGGSGNGPNYVPGPIRVAGCDPFGLDRDRDGVGCE
ncbi:MAG: hypothetical protein AAF602_00930 [Myxococcota bacterium]